MIVVIKLVALITDDVPVRCRENMTKSTDGPLWAMFPDSGGQNVHPLLLTTNINQGFLHLLESPGFFCKILRPGKSWKMILVLESPDNLS